mmetsp:Transcript_87081/g.247089  ORF Transcript_87081/g.247089 Transcript_87081/m.247089 type:complete len:442 (+) Transcript_87081:120-1445(+)
MKNDFVHATTGMPFPHKAHTRADYLAASPALISKHGRPTCQPVGGRPAAASGGSKEKAAVSPSQLTTLMAGLVGLWVEAERPEDVPPAANVHKLLTSTRVWLTKYHRHREKHDSFANHPNCKGCRGLHAVEQYCTNQLRLAVSSGDPLRVREVQGALSQMRVAPLPLEVRSPLPTAPVVQQAPRTVRAAVMHPAPPSAHRHMPPAGTWPGLCVKAGRPDSDDATDIPPPTSAPRLTLFSPLSSHAPLRSSGRQQRAGRAPPARVPARAGRTSARVPARAADAPPAAAPARHAGATARGPGPRLGLVDVELRERLGERRLGLRSRRRAPHRHPHRCRRGGSDGRGGHEPDLDHEPGGVRVPCSRSVTFHAVQLRQAEGVNLLALFRLRQSPRTFPTLFEPLNQLPCPPGSSQQLLNADLFPTYSHDCLPSDPRPYSRVFSFL